MVLAIGITSDVDSRYISFGPTLATSEPSKSNLTFRRTESEPSWSPDDESLCAFDTISVDMPTQSVWGSFTCALLGDRDGSDECEVTEGYFYFENCKPREL